MQQCKIKTYEKYKDSGSEWIGEIPEGWSIKRLKVLAKLQTGNTPPKENDINTYYSDEGFLWVKPDNLCGFNPIKNTNEYLNEEGYKIARVATKGTPLVCCIGSIGKFGVAEEDVAFNQQINAVIFNKRMDNKFGLYHISCQEEQHWFYANGNVVQILNTQNQAKLLLACPTKDEQQQIADYLDKKCGEVDRVVEVQKQIIEKLKEYKQSVITEAVTKGLDKNAPLKDSGIEWIGKIPQHWNIQRIKTLGEYRNGLTYSPDEISDEDSGILVLRSSNISNRKIIFKDNVYINKIIPENMMLKIGDILICSRNGSRELVGKNAIIDFNFRASFGAFMMIFRCTCYKYMYYILNSHIFNYYLGSFYTSTINQLTGKNFGDMNIVYCNNTDEQNVIVEYLDKKCSEIDKAISEKEVLIEKLTQYKKSLIYECVTGKRKVV